jgi:hypothetical protein
VKSICSTLAVLLLTTTLFMGFAHAAQENGASDDAPIAASSETAQPYVVPPLNLPYHAPPVKLHSDNMDRFYIDYGEKVIRWKIKEDRVFKFPAPKGWSLLSIDNWVSPVDGKVWSLKKISKTVCHGRKCETSTTYWEYHQVNCSESGKCRDQQIASWSRRTKQKNYTSYSASHSVTEKGTVLLTLTKTRHSEKETKSTTTYTCGSKKCDKKTTTDTFYNEMEAPPHYRVSGGEDDFEYGVKNIPLQGESIRKFGERLSRIMAQLNRTVVYDRAGVAHVLFHDPKTNGFAHYYVDETSGVPIRKKALLDTAEAGTSNTAVRYGDKGIVTFGYFYRNAFYKGIRAVVFEDASSQPTHNFVWQSSRDENPGWNLMAASTPQGRILVGYTKNPLKKNTSYQLRAYTNVQQIIAEKKTEPTGWERNHSKWFVQSGIGPWYVMWDYSTSVPSEVGGDQKPKYDIAPSLMVEGYVEARYEKYMLGASYVKSVIGEELEDEAGGSAKQAYDSLMGLVGWDDIFAYHNLRLGYRKGDMTTSYTLGDESHIIDSTYTRMDMFLLNTWRLRYGLFYQTYESRLPIAVWYIREGEKEYELIDFFHSDVEFNDYGLTVGFSRLDYAAKYENEVFDWFVDTDIGIGMSTANLAKAQKVTIPSEDDDRDDDPEEKSIDNISTFMVPFNLEGGVLYYKRYYNARGFGWFGRAGYRVEGSYAGSSEKPEDKDEPAEDSQVSATYQRTEIRHGPFLMFGLVF